MPNSDINWCPNPHCEKRENLAEAECCHHCGTNLLLNGRFRLLKPLTPLNHPTHPTEVFEAVDLLGEGLFRKRGDRAIVKMHVRGLIPKLLEREAECLCVTFHPCTPNVEQDDLFRIPIQEDGFAFEQQCLAMSKIEGQNLQDWLEEHGPVSQETALAWLKQLTEIIDCVHNEGFIHADIKPANIIMQPNGTLALIDFGGAQAANDIYLANVGSGDYFGKVYRKGWFTAVMSAGYAPPEQCDHKTLPQSDIFAVGRTIMHAVTGSGPTTSDYDDFGFKHWKEKAPQVDRSFAKLIDWLQDPVPGRRPMNTKVILEYLGERLLPAGRPRDSYYLPDDQFELLLTLKVKALPNYVYDEEGWKVFKVETDSHDFRVLLKPKTYQRMIEATRGCESWEVHFKAKSWTSEGYNNTLVVKNPRMRVICHQ